MNIRKIVFIASLTMMYSGAFASILMNNVKYFLLGMVCSLFVLVIGFHEPKNK